MKLSSHHSAARLPSLARLGALVVGVALLLATPALAAKVVDVRVGLHKDFTRVVFETDAPSRYRIERAPDGTLRIYLSASAAPKKVTSRSPVLQTLVVKPDPRGSVAQLDLRSKPTQVKEMLLAKPPRIVIDLTHEPRPATKTGATDTARKAGVTTTTAKTPSPAPKATPTPTPKVATTTDSGSEISDARVAELARKLNIGQAPADKITTAGTQRGEAVKRAVGESATTTTTPGGTTTTARDAASAATRLSGEAATKTGEIVAKTGEAVAKTGEAIAKSAGAAATKVGDRADALAERAAGALAATRAAQAGATAPSGPGATGATPPGSGSKTPTRRVTHTAPPPTRATTPPTTRPPATTPTPRTAATPPTSRTASSTPKPAADATTGEDGGGFVPGFLKSPLGLAGVGAVLVAGILFFVLRGRRQDEVSEFFPTPDDDAPFSLDDSPNTLGGSPNTLGDSPNQGAVAHEDSAGSGHGLGGDLADTAFQDDGIELPTEDDKPDEARGAVTVDQGMDTVMEPGISPPPGMGANADMMRMFEELERRVTRLEKQLEETSEAKERLERQVAAQTEELRVQRSAIARTQRALRSMARPSDEATEPVPKG